MPLFFPFFLLLNLVSVVFEHPVIPLSNSHPSFHVLIRNQSELPLEQVRLTGHSEGLTFRTDPLVFLHVNPAQRIVFRVTVERNSTTVQGRIPISFTLSSTHHPSLARFEISGDTKIHPELENGWIDVGSIEIRQTDSFSKNVVTLMVCVVPLLLLIGYGFFLKNKAKG